MKTGIYVRAKGKDGNFGAFDVTELDEVEMNSFIDAHASTGNNGWNWVRQLVKFIAGLPDSIPYQEPAPEKEQEPEEKPKKLKKA